MFSQTTKDHNFLTVKETAKLLRLSEGTLYNKIYQGELDYVKLFGKILFDAEYIHQLINSKRVQSKNTQSHAIRI